MQPLSLAIRRPNDLDGLLHVDFDDTYNELSFNGSAPLVRTIDAGMPGLGHFFKEVLLPVRGPSLEQAIYATCFT